MEQNNIILHAHPLTMEHTHPNGTFFSHGSTNKASQETTKQTDAEQL